MLTHPPSFSLPPCCCPCCAADWKRQYDTSKRTVTRTSYEVRPGVGPWPGLLPQGPQVKPLPLHPPLPLPAPQEDMAMAIGMLSAQGARFNKELYLAPIKLNLPDRY